MPKTAKAYVNWGRWLAHCPRCGVCTELQPGQAQFACAACHKDLLAIAFRQDPDGLFRPVADEAARVKAFSEAVDVDEIYTVIWPEDPEAIQDALRPRAVPNMNWEPGVAVETLRADNAEKGLA